MYMDLPTCAITTFPFPFTAPTWSFNPICSCIPEGYELIEKPGHAKKRLEEQINITEREIKYYTSRAAELIKELEKYKKELKKFGDKQK